MTPIFRRGQNVAGYSLVKRLGAGGNSEVWRARGKGGAEVALKLLRARRGEPYRRFAREVREWQRLSDVAGVVPVLDAHLPRSPGEQAWLAMPVLKTLGSHITSNATIDSVIDAMLQVARVLMSLHSRDVFHRDIKPENLFVENGRVLVGDFGLVDAPGVEPITNGARAVGARHYIAPEMINTPDVARGGPVDVYCLGKTLWVLLTGQRSPLPGEQRTFVEGLCASSYLVHPRGRELDALIDAMTRYDPEQRPIMTEVADELAAWLSPESSSDAPTDYSAMVRTLQRAGAWRDAEAEQRTEDSAVLAAAADAVARAAQRNVADLAASGFTVDGDLLDPNHSVGESLIGYVRRPRAGGEVASSTRSVAVYPGKSRLGPFLILWAGATKIIGDPEISLAVGIGLAGHAAGTADLWQEAETIVSGGPATQYAADKLAQLQRSQLPETLGQLRHWAASPYRPPGEVIPSTKYQ
jgi:hypothetical protein